MTMDNPPDGGPENMTVSGLREQEIDPKDLAELRSSCRLHSLDIKSGAGLPVSWVEPGLLPEWVNTAELEIGAPRSLKLRIVPLPKKAKVRRLRIAPPRVPVNRGLPLMLEQPVTRNRMLMGELGEGQHKTLFKKIFEKYGEMADRLHVAAVFAHIPPEAARSIELDPDLRSLRFTLPTDVSPRGMTEGYYLVVLHGDPGETKNLLVRL